MILYWYWKAKLGLGHSWDLKVKFSDWDPLTMAEKKRELQNDTQTKNEKLKKCSFATWAMKFNCFSTEWICIKKNGALGHPLD